MRKLFATLAILGGLTISAVVPANADSWRYYHHHHYRHHHHAVIIYRQ
jgi:hypothetical protein